MYTQCNLHYYNVHTLVMLDEGTFWHVIDETAVYDLRRKKLCISLLLLSKKKRNYKKVISLFLDTVQLGNISTVTKESRNTKSTKTNKQKTHRLLMYKLNGFSAFRETTQS